MRPAPKGRNGENLRGWMLVHYCMLYMGVGDLRKM